MWVRLHFGDLSGKTVIDCMNPIARTPDGMGLAVGHTTSGAEQVANWLPGANIVKTLNQVGAEIIADTSGFAMPPVMFMAGDDDGAKAVVAGLLTDLGFEPLDAGDLARARLLEPYALVWINQAILRGKGRSWAFAAVERGRYGTASAVWNIGFDLGTALGSVLIGALGVTVLRAVFGS